MLSGGLTQEDEDAVDDELAEILKEQLPEVPLDDIRNEEPASAEEAAKPAKKGKMAEDSPGCSINLSILEKAKKSPSATERVAMEA